MKKYAKMDDLAIEFEMKAETNDKLKPFLADVSERLLSMTSFKKVFLKFQLTVEVCLKNVALYSYMCSATLGNEAAAS